MANDGWETIPTETASDGWETVPSVPSAPAPAVKAPETSTVGKLANEAGKGLRGVLQGAGGLTDLLGGPLNATVNAVTGSQLSTSPGHELGAKIADALGLALPENDLDELGMAINEGGIQGLLSAGAGMGLSGAKGVTGVIGKALAESPLLDTVSGMFSGGSQELTKQAGVGEGGQLAAAIAGGMLPFGAVGAGRGITRALRGEADEVPAESFRLSPEAEAAYKDKLGNATIEDINSFAEQNGIQLDPDQLARFVADRDAKKPVQVEARYEGPTAAEEAAIADAAPGGWEPVPEAQAPVGEGTYVSPSKAEVGRLAKDETARSDLADPVLEGTYAAPSEAELGRLGDDPLVAGKAPDSPIHQAVDETISGWKNAPEVEVLPNFDKTDGADSTNLGGYDPETGKVLLNADAIAKEAAHRGLTPDEMTRTVLFHEGLGHHGLAQKFRTDLDGTLDNWYEKSPYFKKQVDDWMARNPDAYPDEDNFRARAGEEILAEMSEKGAIPRKLLDTLKNVIKAAARDFGFDWKISKREIETVLAQAHDNVINGAKADAGTAGFRAMKSSFGSGSEGPQRGEFTRDVEGGEVKRRTPVGRYRSERNLDDIIAEATPEKDTESWEQWIHEAGKTKMSRDIAVKLAKGAEAPELLAAKEYFLKSANRIDALSKKAVNGTLTPRESAMLSKEMQRAKDVAESLMGVTTNAARLLNASKIEIATDKALSDSIRKMLSTADPELFKTPEGLKELSEQLVRDKVKAKRMAKILDVLGNALNLPRSLMSTLDLSAPFRQGVFLVGRKEFWKNLPDMFRQFGSDSFFKGQMKEIASRPTFKLMEESGLALSSVGKKLTEREEQFMSNWAGKIPLVGPFVKASERAYTGFLNKLRADTFDSLVKLSGDAGIDFKTNPKALTDISSFVNNATGRGDLGGLNKAAPILSGLFFSPRLIASRVNMLRPDYYVRLSPVVRKEAIKSLLSFGAIAGTIASLASMGGADVETDPRSSDFAKIKTGNTRYDILGGFGQYLTLGARLAKNEKKDMKGDIQTLGKKFGSDNRLDVLENFGVNKFSPIASYVADFLRGKDGAGNEFSAAEGAVKRFIPLFLQDAKEMTDAQGGGKGALMASPGLFGIGTQTFDPPKGTDRFGRSYAEKRDRQDPVEVEINRLEADGDTVLGFPKKTFVVGGEKKTFSDKEYEAYAKKAGENFHEVMSEAMDLPLWQDADDDLKKKMVRKIATESRASARGEMYGELEDDETSE